MTAEISPLPSDDEVVAIVAALSALWPTPVVDATTQNPLRVPSWRFSGRWWARPLPSRRDRPYR